MDVFPIDAALQPPPRTLAVRAGEFEEWIEHTEPGQRVEYHRGYLVIDRARGFSPFAEKLRRELDAVADRALVLAEDGRLLLVQQRHGYGDYSYFAIKPKRPPGRRSA